MNQGTAIQAREQAERVQSILDYMINDLQMTDEQIKSALKEIGSKMGIR